MEKDFDGWNMKKKEIDKRVERLYFRDGEVWWVNFGLNIGYALNGKGEDFWRPVVVLKKYNEYSFIALPLSTTSKRNKYLISAGEIDGKQAVAVLSQIRNIDSKRLVNKIAHLERETLAELKEKTSRINFD